MSDPHAPTPPEDAGRRAELGAMLVGAREAKGLELSDVAELTHVRKEYLKALEDGRYDDLPEDVYTRNFVRLYAQAVSLDVDRVLETYVHERRRAVGMSTLEQRLDQERRGEPPPAPRGGLPFGPLLPTLLLVAVVVALAVWGFNSLLFRPTRTVTERNAPAPTVRVAPDDAGAVATGAAGDTAGDAAAPDTSLAAPVGTPSADAPAGVVGDAVESRTVRVSITTTPPGATVTIDGFALPGTTPIRDAPVTARDGRVVRATLDGYRPAEQQVDLRQDRTVALTLEPLAAAPAAGADASQASTVGAGQIGIDITERTWLEVYASTQRNQGQRLVYATVDPGTSYVFDLPVYLHVGNAAGVDIVLDGKDQGPMGSSGAVVSRAYPAR